MVRLGALILDLDGTVYLGADEVPGAARFVAAMQARGVRCLFVTNRASRTGTVVAAQLRGYGIPCADGDVLTTAEVAAAYVGGRPTYLIGETGIHEAFAAAGVPVTDTAPDFVVASLDRAFDYAKLQRACRLIQGGARFVLTNPDAWLRLDEGVVPGAGAIGAAIEVGSGVRPVVLGKPEPALFLHVLHRLQLPPEAVVAIGDNLATDIPAAARAGLRSVLMLTGVSTRADVAAAAVQPTWIAESYTELAALLEPLAGP